MKIKFLQPCHNSDDFPLNLTDMDTFGERKIHCVAFQKVCLMGFILKIILAMTFCFWAIKSS